MDERELFPRPDIESFTETSPNDNNLHHSAVSLGNDQRTKVTEKKTLKKAKSLKKKKKKKQKAIHDNNPQMPSSAIEGTPGETLSDKNVSEASIRLFKNRIHTMNGLSALFSSDIDDSLLCEIEEGTIAKRRKTEPMVASSSNLQENHKQERNACPLKEKQSNQQAKRALDINRKESSKKTERKSKLSTPACKFWLAGKCQRGKECTFAHIGDPVSIKHSELCKFFKSGACAKGEQCNYSHDLKSEQCRFFASGGNCVYGDNCRWGHFFSEEKTFPEMENSSLKKSSDIGTPSPSMASLPLKLPEVPESTLLNQMNSPVTLISNIHDTAHHMFPQQTPIPQLLSSTAHQEVSSGMPSFLVGNNKSTVEVNENNVGFNSSYLASCFLETNR